MEELNLVTEGFKFMVLGMVTVFLFLILMVVVLKFQAKIVGKFFPPPQISNVKTDGTQLNKEQNSDILVAVVSAAIKKFQNQK